MGYRTDWTLTVKNKENEPGFPQDPEGIVKFLSEETDYYWEDYGGRTTAEPTCYRCHDAKWYDWQKDMTTISKRFPGMEFLVEGNGEEQGDHHYSLWVGGRSKLVQAKISFAPFDSIEWRG